MHLIVGSPTLNLAYVPGSVELMPKHFEKGERGNNALTKKLLRESAGSARVHVVIPGPVSEAKPQNRHRNLRTGVHHWHLIRFG